MQVRERQNSQMRLLEKKLSLGDLSELKVLMSFFHVKSTSSTYAHVCTSKQKKITSIH